jgi:CubicO group peptidase (beta-lactamase class C family)
MYRAAGFELAPPEGCDLAECCDLWAGLPLSFEPGSGWNYSVASDVLGRVVEVVSGMSLDRFFAERVERCFVISLGWRTDPSVGRIDGPEKVPGP